MSFSILENTVAYFRKLVSRSRYYRFAQTLGGRDAESIFAHIYRQNLWGGCVSRSGPGSDLENTRNLRKALPRIVDDLDIRIFLDAPCGDFNWMRFVNFPDDIVYVGVDIVPELITQNRNKYANGCRTFLQGDISNDDLQQADMMFCRDCLFHLSNADIFSVLTRFVDSKTRFLMTSTHINFDKFSNQDIATGDFRRIDLFSAPFNFPQAVLFRILDSAEPSSPKEMCVWTREQINYVLKE